MRFVSAGQNQLHDREAAFRDDYLANIGENADGVFVIPIILFAEPDRRSE
jgi:hypothetical protein